MNILEVIDVSKSFGGLSAISDLSFEVQKGEILGLIGPNGAGKTTLFNLITRVYKPTKGIIKYKSNDLSKYAPCDLAKIGIARTFQSTILYHEMTVLENVMVGAHLHSKLNFWGAILNSGSYRKNEKLSEQKSMEIIDFMGLGSVKGEKAKNLPHGHQRKLGVCIALITNPELLLLDEPVTGMNPVEIDDMVKGIKKIQEQLGITLVVIEHHMKALMGISDRILVLNFGLNIAQGLPQEIKQNQQVIEAYLGREEH